MRNWSTCAALWLALSALVAIGCDDDAPASSHPDPGAAVDAPDTTADAPDVPAEPDVPPVPDVPPKTVTLSGVTYRFNTPDPVPDVKVCLAEDPDNCAMSGADGRYSLVVPDDATITPFSQHESFVDLYLQTFTTAGADIDKVYFQLVTPEVFDLFALAIGIEPDDSRCQIASTVNTKEIQSLTFEAFTQFGHHGVAGATVTIAPPVEPIIYFNESTIPDTTLTETTIDGGVVVGNVEPGSYTLTAHHPTREFEQVVVDCQPGRLINPNPPWGLREK